MPKRCAASAWRHQLQVNWLSGPGLETGVTRELVAAGSAPTASAYGGGGVGRPENAAHRRGASPSAQMPANSPTCRPSAAWLALGTADALPGLGGVIVQEQLFGSPLG